MQIRETLIQPQTSPPVIPKTFPILGLTIKLLAVIIGIGIARHLYKKGK